MTRPAIHDTLYRKSHQICRKVQNGEGLFPMKIFTAPQHTRSILPLFHPTKFFACLAGRYFSFGKLYLESYISRLNEILRHDLTLSVGEPDNAAAKQGQELRSEQTVTPLHEQHHLYLFLRLNNSETFVENAF